MGGRLTFYMTQMEDPLRSRSLEESMRVAISRKWSLNRWRQPLN